MIKEECKLFPLMGKRDGPYFFCSVQRIKKFNIFSTEFGAAKFGIIVIAVVLDTSR
jgi:hypothetical protein